MRTLGTGLAVAAALLCGCAYASDLESQRPEAGDEESLPADGRLSRYEDLNQEHVAGEVDYPDEDVRPPAGGPHNPAWQNCGVYTEPIASEHAVHSLEHGAVWITYAPELDPAVAADVEAAVGTSGFVLVSPYDAQESPIVLSAWGVQLEVDDIEGAPVDAFLTRYVRGPQTPEVGAPCTGGTSATGADTELRSFA